MGEIGEIRIVEEHIWRDIAAIGRRDFLDGLCLLALGSGNADESVELAGELGKIGGQVTGNWRFHQVSNEGAVDPVFCLKQAAPGIVEEFASVKEVVTAIGFGDVRADRIRGAANLRSHRLFFKRVPL